MPSSAFRFVVTTGFLMFLVEAAAGSFEATSLVDRGRINKFPKFIADGSGAKPQPPPPPQSVRSRHLRRKRAQARNEKVCKRRCTKDGKTCVRACTTEVGCKRRCKRLPRRRSRPKRLCVRVCKEAPAADNPQEMDLVPPETPPETKAPKTKAPETKAPETTTMGEVRNDVRWYDDHGAEIRCNDGGHVTKVGDTYYWVGNDPDTGNNGNDVHMYSSKTLGSSDWRWEGNVVDYEPGRYQGSCQLVANPNTGKYLIICKGLNIYESDDVTGPYASATNIWPTMVPFHRGYAWGGMSIYQEGNDAYLVVSRYDKTDSSGTRHMGIYKLAADYKSIASEVSWTRGTVSHRREAPWVFKRNGKYYMTMSHTRGWNPSETYYWTADGLEGPWIEQGQVGTDPPTKTSYNSQHRYIIQVGSDEFVYGGDRYPLRGDADVYPKEKGRNIMLPVTWDGDRPVLHFKETWTINDI
jgi:hypothetical protein